MSDTTRKQVERLSFVRETSGANAIEAVGGYTGRGRAGRGMDGGLRTSHQEFAARPPVLHGSNSTGTSHGTSTYGETFAPGVSAALRACRPTCPRRARTP